jgi:hypothetical protein
VGPAVLVRATLILLIFGAAIATPTDADLWGHLAFGRDIVASGQPVQTDIYSFTTDRPWVNHEWLSEVAFFVAYRAGGSIGLIALKLIMIGAILFAIWHYLRRFADRNTTWILIAATFVGTFWRTHNVRPQLFSVLLLTLLLICIRSADSGRRARLLFVPLIAAVWANLHGGWILGLAVYGLWATARLADQDVSRRERVFPLAIGIVAFAATLLNPWGPQLWGFLSETVRPDRADIEEWSSITQYPVVLGIPWLLTLALAVLAVWRSGLPERRDYLGIIALLSVLAFLVGRLDAFFVLAVVILLAPQIVKLWPMRQPARATTLQPGIAVVTVVGIVALAVPVARFAAPYSTCLPITGSWAPDAEAARFISENRLTGRMMTWFDWGEYVIWHFGPAVKVSMDGRRETVYSEAAIAAHQRFYRGGAPAISYAQELSPNFIWLPASLPVAQQLQAAGWNPIFDGTTSKVWAQALISSAPRGSELSRQSTPRCFPGP